MHSLLFISNLLCALTIGLMQSQSKLGSSSSSSSSSGHHNATHDGVATGTSDLSLLDLDGNCSVCSRREHSKVWRLESIRSQILSELRLKQAPNISRDTVNRLLPKAPPLQQLLDHYGYQDVLEARKLDRDNLATTETIINVATGTDKKVQSNGRPKCCFFKFTPRSMQNQVIKARLWVYLRPAKKSTSVIVKISRLQPVAGAAPRHVHMCSRNVSVDARSGRWEEIDFRRVVHNWFRQPDANWGVEINGLDAEGNDYAVTSPDAAEDGLKPFLELKLSDTLRRSRRAPGLDCSEASNESRCCRYQLIVDFEAFGWDWIIAPKRYKANYCSGQCENMFLQKYPHTHLVQKANPRGSAGPCCAPTKMSAISMLYFNDQQQIIFGKIPDMVVERCGCS